MRTDYPAPVDTKSADYARYLRGRRTSWWKSIVPVQAPYRWNLRRLNPGFVLDIGCGVGRNLAHLDGHGVGVDHNAHCVAEARSRGLTVYTTEEFGYSEHARPGRFDSLLIAHVLEHLPRNEQELLIQNYIDFLKPDGRVIFITPQEAGFRADSTHVDYVDSPRLSAILSSLGAREASVYSFPFPRAAGKFFTHNEFVAVGTIPASVAETAPV